IVGMATTPKDPKKAEAEAEKAKAEAGVPEATATDETLPIKGSLILSITENGYGKRTPADEYRLQGRGGSGVINVKTTERNGKVTGIAQVSESSEVMLISQYGKIIRMDSSTIRESRQRRYGNTARVPPKPEALGLSTCRCPCTSLKALPCQDRSPVPSLRSRCNESCKPAGQRYRAPASPDTPSSQSPTAPRTN